MSLLNTKPRWFVGEVIATERGWVNPKNNEVLVAIGNLKEKLAQEGIVPEIVTPVVQEKEVVMEITPEVKKRKEYAPRKPKVIAEVVEQKIESTQQIIGEVVDYTPENNIIAE